jgi:hypothetical protein
VNNWFKNHRRQAVEEEDGVDVGDRRLMTSWTVRKVVKEVLGDEIDARIKKKNPNCVAGTAAYIQLYQSCWSEVHKGLSAERRREFEQMALKWNKEGTDRGVQARSVVRKLCDTQLLISSSDLLKKAFLT